VLGSKSHVAVTIAAHNTARSLQGLAVESVRHNRWTGCRFFDQTACACREPPWARGQHGEPSVPERRGEPHDCGGSRGVAGRVTRTGAAKWPRQTGASIHQHRLSRMTVAVVTLTARTLARRRKLRRALTTPGIRQVVTFTGWTATARPVSRRLCRALRRR